MLLRAENIALSLSVEFDDSEIVACLAGRTARDVPEVGEFMFPENLHEQVLRCQWAGSIVLEHLNFAFVDVVGCNAIVAQVSAPSPHWDDRVPRALYFGARWNGSGIIEAFPRIVLGSEALCRSSRLIALMG